MVRFGIQASHEQINPADLLNDVIAMDRLGIERCWSSDHYMPWWHTGAAGGAAWPWLGAALARTQKITIGTGVTAPILRYHPAVVAQVFATLDYMFPGRVFLGIGRGESQRSSGRQQLAFQSGKVREDARSYSANQEAVGGRLGNF